MRCFYHVGMLWMFLCASFPWELSGVQTTHVRVEESAGIPWCVGRSHRRWPAPSPMQPGDGPAKLNKSPH